jgi:hypothetical protein
VDFLKSVPLILAKDPNYHAVMIVPKNDTQKSRIKLKVEQEEVEELIQDL